MKETPRSERPDVAIDRTCDAIATGLTPANAFEAMLLNTIAQNYERRQRLIELENYFYAHATPAMLLTDSFDKVKTLQRMVLQADRAYRQALNDFYRAQRNRVTEAKRVQVNSTRSARPTPPPVEAAPVVQFAEPRPASAGRASPATN